MIFINSIEQGDDVMLVKPPIDELTEKVDSKYTLVTLEAKRARELTEGDEPLVKADTNKAVSVALEEIYNDKITYLRTKEGIK